MENLETGLGQNPSLTPEEIKAAEWLEKMIPGSYSILSVIKRLFNEEKDSLPSLYSLAKKRKPEFSGHFNKLQTRWLEEHVVYIDGKLKAEHKDNSHEAINKSLTEEILGPEGENTRCCIYYAMMFPERIDPSYLSQFSTLLGKIEQARKAE